MNKENKLVDRYNEIKNQPGITGGVDKLIIDCFRYKILKENPSIRFKNSFEKMNDSPYPEFVGDIGRHLAAKLRRKVEICRADEELQLKVQKQRAKRGYSDLDVWGIDIWFVEIAYKILKDYRKHHNGYPTKFLLSLHPTQEEDEQSSAKWNEVLDRMIFLLNEMGAGECTMTNPFERPYSRINDKFEREIGLFGEKAKDRPELMKKDKSGGRKMYTPSDFPDLYPTYKEVYEKWSACNKEIEKYREDCKNEFFKLFSEYFRDLWD